MGNPEQKQRRVYSIDPKTGEETYKIVALDWVNPVDANSGDQKDIQVEPENNQTKKSKKKKRKAKKKKNKHIRKKNKKGQPRSAIGNDGYHKLN